MRADRWHEGAALMNCQIGKKAHYVLFKIERIWSWCRQIWHQNTSLARKSPFFAKKRAWHARVWVFKFAKKWVKNHAKKLTPKNEQKMDVQLVELFLNMS